MKRFHFHWRGLGADPSFDWYLCLSLFAAALLAAAAFDAFLFFDFTAAPSSQEGTADQPVALNRADIERAAEKAHQRDAAPRSVPPSVLRDPSL